MLKKHRFFFASLSILCLFSFRPVYAREIITDWYIQNFETEILVNKDSSLDITERITADCGNLPDKHGIFRIFPEKINIEGKETRTPIRLESITDFSGKKIKYKENRSERDGTITWKIGDPGRTVIGVNNYEIKYSVKNAIRFGGPDFDEFYWNLNGNFWQLETDKFKARLIFPEEIKQQDVKVDYYTGALGSKGKELAAYDWTASNILEFQSTQTLRPGEGITASVASPKNIFTPYRPTFWETYGNYFWFIFPLLVFIIGFRYWYKYGRDPRLDKTIIPEYGSPGNLPPMELGYLTEGKFKNSFITAEIIYLASKGFIEIKEIQNKILFFSSQDYQLTRKRDPAKKDGISQAQKYILDYLFASGASIKLSDLKYKFYKAVDKIKNSVEFSIEEKGLISPLGKKYQTWFIVLGVLLIIFSVVALVNNLNYFGTSLLISGIIILIFSLNMPRRTEAGAELNWQIKGFKLFMKTVNKDRAEFYEKENIFEKFLPYAMIFGITSLWIKKMKEIYGEEYLVSHAPVWYIGSSGSFDVDAFSSRIESLSAAISSSSSSPSGSGGGGGGFSGGGGGGGGGGGW